MKRSMRSFARSGWWSQEVQRVRRCRRVRAGAGGEAHGGIDRYEQNRGLLGSLLGSLLEGSHLEGLQAGNGGGRLNKREGTRKRVLLADQVLHLSSSLAGRLKASPPPSSRPPCPPSSDAPLHLSRWHPLPGTASCASPPPILQRSSSASRSTRRSTWDLRPLRGARLTSRCTGARQSSTLEGRRVVLSASGSCCHR